MVEKRVLWRALHKTRTTITDITPRRRGIARSVRLQVPSRASWVRESKESIMKDNEYVTRTREEFYAEVRATSMRRPSQK